MLTWDYTIFSFMRDLYTFYKQGDTFRVESLNERVSLLSALEIFFNFVFSKYKSLCMSIKKKQTTTI